MEIFRILSLIIFVAFSVQGYAQVKIRLFSNQNPESVVLSVTRGEYEINLYNGYPLPLAQGESAVISKFNGRLVVSILNSRGIICDSVQFSGKSTGDLFSLRINGKIPDTRNYSGDIICYPDLSTIMMINICNVEQYIAGVVKAEGGAGKYKEYFKTQALLARTYMYKYFDKHMPDRYNLCDNTHCQAFNGICTDTLINSATLETSGKVILSQDSTLIIAAFHSNCGGETVASEDIWLTGVSYLKSVIDPYCLTSRNAKWEKSQKISDWIKYLKESGYDGDTINLTAFNFMQQSRSLNYTSGSFTMPLKTIRNDLNLRSTFFSVSANTNSVVFKGRGYGHGVGLCQEGAMAMAAKGFTCSQIIDFYYFGVLISDIKNAVVLPLN